MLRQEGSYSPAFRLLLSQLSSVSDRCCCYSGVLVALVLYTINSLVVGVVRSFCPQAPCCSGTLMASLLHLANASVVGVVRKIDILETELKRLRPKRRKKVPNPNKRFMDLSEILARGHVVQDEVEEVEEVKGVEEEEAGDEDEGSIDGSVVT